MVNGIGIIRDSFQNFLNSLHHTVRRLLFRLLGGTDEQLLISLDGETRMLLSDFAEHSQLTPEEAAVCWLTLQASAYQQDRAVAQVWATLTPREQQALALCCLEYSDHEIAAMLGIAYATPRTHLYKAIDKLGINKKSDMISKSLGARQYHTAELLSTSFRSI
jgi:DNA-binding CsgD family transcriptional regulator